MTPLWHVASSISGGAQILHFFICSQSMCRAWAMSKHKVIMFYLLNMLGYNNEDFECLAFPCIS